MKIIKRKHTGYRSSCGCTYGLAYYTCPEHGGQPVVRIIRLEAEEPIGEEKQADFEIRS